MTGPPWLLAVALLAGRISPSPEVVDSSQIKEDPVAGKKAEAQFLKHLEREDRHLRLRFDREHLRQHDAVLASLRKARGRFDGVRSERGLDAAREDARRTIADVQQKMHDIDPWRNGTTLFKDYDFLIKLLETDYPRALQTSFGGDRRALMDVRKQFNDRMKQVRSWLAEAAKEGDEEE